MQVSLSLWSLDQAWLAAEVKQYDEVVDSFHVDVMDGNFTDYLLYGPLAVQILRRLTVRLIVVHLSARAGAMGVAIRRSGRQRACGTSNGMPGLRWYLWPPFGRRASRQGPRSDSRSAPTLYATTLQRYRPSW
jgi:hypothetical protein